MAADCGSVKYGPKQSGEPLDDTSRGVRESELIQPGIMATELVAKVGNPKMPGDGFADDLEAVQAEQRLVEIPVWPD